MATTVLRMNPAQSARQVAIPRTQEAKHRKRWDVNGGRREEKLLGSK